MQRTPPPLLASLLLLLPFACALPNAALHSRASSTLSRPALSASSILMAAAATGDAQEEAAPAAPPRLLLCATAALQSACFGCIGTALPPALRASGLAPAEVALTLGRLGSISALFEVMLSGWFGRLADAIGRKPILLAAPLITVAARACVVVRPSLPVLLGARMITTLVVPMYWLAFQASCADVYATNATELAVLGSRVQASMGFGYALSSLVGGPLAQRDIRLAYAASCLLGCGVAALLALGLRETLPRRRRVPLAVSSKSGNGPLGFVRLFRRGVLAAKLNTCVLLQSLTNGMGDLWQVGISSRAHAPP